MDDPRYDGKHPVCVLCNGHGSVFLINRPAGRPVHVSSTVKGEPRDYWLKSCECGWSEPLERRGEMVWA